jgi:hypothetical protein
MRRARSLGIALAGLCALGLTLSTSGLARAQAEPAPEGYIPPGRNTPLPPTATTTPPASPTGEPGAPPYVKPEPPPLWHVAAGPRMAVRLGSGPPKLPLIGYGGGVNISRALVPFGRLRFGVGFDFAYDRVFRDLPAPLIGSQELSHATFAAVAVVDGLFGRVRPFLEAGGGLSVGDYNNPDVAAGAKPDSAIEALGLIHLALGLGVRVWESFEIGLRGELNLTFSSTQLGTPPAPVFAPGLFDLALDLGWRF